MKNLVCYTAAHRGNVGWCLRISFCLKDRRKNFNVHECFQCVTAGAPIAFILTTEEHNEGY